MKLWQRWKQTAIHNKLLVWTSILVAAGTIFYACAAAFQIFLMNQSAKHTDEQIGRIIENVNWMARSMDWSQKQAQESLNATITQYHLDQRAWVGISEITGEPVVGKVWEVSAALHNSGRSFAKSLHGPFVFEELSQGEEPIFKYTDQDLKNGPRGGLISPNGTVYLNTVLSRTASGKPANLSQKFLDIVNSETQRVYAHGKLEYSDISGAKHWLTLCYYWAPTSHGFVSCQTHNDTGDYK